MVEELFLAGRRADERTDKTKLTVAVFFFFSFANAPKNYCKVVESISEARLAVLVTKL